MKTYYKYEYILGSKEVTIREYEDYEEPVLNFVEESNNRLGETRFYMRSDSADNREFFMKGIAKILCDESTVAARFAELALGRYYQFNEFWKGQDKNV